MSILSESWPQCPEHLTWMQPHLKPREWRCNISRCDRTHRYRWWRYADQRAFAVLEVNEEMRHYYCPIHMCFFAPDGKLETKYDPPYFRLCSKCIQMGTEHTS